MRLLISNEQMFVQLCTERAQRRLRFGARRQEEEARARAG